MLYIKTLPIVKKINLLKFNHIKNVSKYHALCLSVIIPHSSTDMWIHPVKKWSINYGSSITLFMFQPIRIKFIVLLMYSLYHIKNDISAKLPLQILYSCGIHFSWFIFPEWVLSYLAFIHVSLHYFRTFPLLNSTQLFTLLLSHIFVYKLLEKNEISELSYGGSWIPLVIGHIMTNA
jgi:hypothetical protein